MRLTCQERRCTKEISLVDVVMDFMVNAICRFRDLDAPPAYQIKRIARLTFAKNGFARFFSQHANFRRDALDDFSVKSFKQAIIVESLDSSGPGCGSHSLQNQPAIDEPSGMAPSI